MIQSQVSQFRCGDCRALFQESTPVDVRVELWIAWVGALRCPECASSKVLMEQRRSASEDAAFEWGEGSEGRVERWLVDGEKGSACHAILERMTGRHQAHKSHPEDVADLRRCMLLLIRMPEWQPRMMEMADVGEHWGMFARAWPMLSNLLRIEGGPDLDKYPTPRTAALVAACACKGELVFERLSEADILAGEGSADGS